MVYAGASPGSSLVNAGPAEGKWRRVFATNSGGATGRRQPASIVSSITYYAGRGCGKLVWRGGRGAGLRGPCVEGRSILPATSPAPGRACQRLALGRASGSRPRYCAVILLHCASAACLTDEIGIFAAAVRQACFALPSAELTFGLLVVI